MLEMSIVLIIISVVVSGAMVVFAESLAAHQVNETTAKMNAIQNALYDFRVQPIFILALRLAIQVHASAVYQPRILIRSSHR